MGYKKDIEKFRAEKNRYFAKHPQSPLSHSIRHRFEGLDYYPIKDKYRFIIPLKEYDNIESVEMNTSDGQTEQYRRIGYLEFVIEGQKSKINVYQSLSDNHYFVPFRDKTSGKETYGAGRYLELEEKNGNFILDFNMAYNPFCAYSDHYSCPFPPVENWLQVPIKVGEKDFKH